MDISQYLKFSFEFKFTSIQKIFLLQNNLSRGNP